MHSQLHHGIIISHFFDASSCLALIKTIHLESGYFPFNRSKYEYEELSEQFYIDDPNGVKILTIALMKRAMERLVARSLSRRNSE